MAVLHLRVGAKFRRRAAPHHLALLDDVVMIGDTGEFDGKEVSRTVIAVALDDSKRFSGFLDNISELAGGIAEAR